jgi:hypothetical protein
MIKMIIFMSFGSFRALVWATDEKMRLKYWTMITQNRERRFEYKGFKVIVPIRE